MTAAWTSLLAQARSELERRNFVEAQRHAEALLQARVPKAVRAGALLVAADAAYALGAYGQSAARYEEFVAREGTAPETRAAPATLRAAMALGWARVRQGDRERARAAWIAVADAHGTDARAPLALALAAEVASKGGDTATSQRLLDRIIARYPSSPYAGTARLSRSALALRRQQEDAALRDLDSAIRVNGPGVIDTRRRLSEAIAASGSEAALEAAPSGAPSPSAGGDVVERFAARVLERQHREPGPHMLHGLVLLAAADRGWFDVLVGALADRLVEEFPTYPAAPALLGRVASAAASAGQWPVARRSYETLLARTPAAVTGSMRLKLGEALFRTGATAAARTQLEQSAAAGGDEAPRALLLLTELHTTAGDRRAALAAYDRLFRDYPRLERSAGSLLTHAQLLEDAGQSQQARPVLQRVVELAQGEVAAEAAYRLAQTFSAEGQNATAVEWYMTAAYAAERSKWGRLAWLGAGRSLTMLKETKEALAAYWKLIPARPGVDVPADREISGEAAYRTGEILRNADLHEDALDMFATSAHLTAGLPTEHRALLGALRCLLATGDRKSAEAVYRRLLNAAANEPHILAQAREALRANGAAASPGGGPTESALPKTTR
jgi:tetratricopeptide (TPR) repeat protein